MLLVSISDTENANPSSAGFVKKMKLLPSSTLLYTPLVDAAYTCVDAVLQTDK